VRTPLEMAANAVNSFPESYSATAEDAEQSTMQAFIRSQMYSIMHPVAEHVREVQAEVQQLAKRLKEADGKVDDNRTCYAEMHNELLSLRKTIASTDANVEKLQVDFGISVRDREKLSADHEATKSDLAKTAGELRTTNVLVKSLQQKSEDLEGDVRSLHTGHEKVGRTLAMEAEKIAQTMELTASLNNRMLDIVAGIDRLSRSGAETDHTLHKWIQQFEKNNAAVSTELGTHQEHIDSIESRLGASQQSIQVNTEAIRGLEERLRLLKAALQSDDGGDLAGSSRSHSRFERETPETTLKVHSDLDGLKASLNKLQELLNSYKDEHSQLLKDLDRRVGDNTTHVEGLQAAKESMSEHLKKHDVLISKTQRSLDAVGGQVDMLQADTKALHVNQTDLGNKVDAQRISLTKNQADLKHTNDTVDSANENLLRIKDALAAMDVTVSKLGSRYDSCSRNVHGVGRGLADVGKHVTQGDHGMLAPKPFNITDVGKPLSHQGEAAMPPRSPSADVTSTRMPHGGYGGYSPLPPPMSPQSRRLHCLHFRTGSSTDGALPSAR